MEAGQDLENELGIVWETKTREPRDLGPKLGVLLRERVESLDSELAEAHADERARVLSAPRIATLLGHPATIETVHPMPVPGPNEDPSATRLVDGEIRLSFTPTMTQEGSLLLDLWLVRRWPKLAPEALAATPTPMVTRQARTQVRVADGETIVVGGLPLGDFGRERQPELLIFLSAEIVDLPGGDEPRSMASVEESHYSGEPINMNLKDADVIEVLRSIAQLTGLNLAIEPGVYGRVTVELKGVRWDQALEEILEMNHLAMERNGDVVRIFAAQSVRGGMRDHRRRSPF